MLLAELATSFAAGITGWQNPWGIFRDGRIWQNSLTNQAWPLSILAVDAKKGSINEHFSYLLKAVKLEEGIHAITAIKKMQTFNEPSKLMTFPIVCDCIYLLIRDDRAS